MAHDSCPHRRSSMLSYQCRIQAEAPVHWKVSQLQSIVLGHNHLESGPWHHYSCPADVDDNRLEIAAAKEVPALRCIWSWRHVSMGSRDAVNHLRLLQGLCCGFNACRRYWWYSARRSHPFYGHGIHLEPGRACHSDHWGLRQHVSASSGELESQKHIFPTDPSSSRVFPVASDMAYCQRCWSPCDPRSPLHLSSSRYDVRVRLGGSAAQHWGVSVRSPVILGVIAQSH